MTATIACRTKGCRRVAHYKGSTGQSKLYRCSAGHVTVARDEGASRSWLEERMLVWYWLRRAYPHGVGAEYVQARLVEEIGADEAPEIDSVLDALDALVCRGLVERIEATYGTSVGYRVLGHDLIWPNHDHIHLVGLDS